MASSLIMAEAARGPRRIANQTIVSSKLNDNPSRWSRPTITGAGLRAIAAMKHFPSAESDGKCLSFLPDFAAFICEAARNGAP